MYNLGDSMRAYIIENDIITNCIEVESLDCIPGLVDASIGGGIGWSYVDGTLTEPAPASLPPLVVSPRQIRQALTAAGMRTAVEAGVAAADQNTQDWWEFATSFEEDHPMIATMASALRITDSQRHDIFVLAASL